MKLIAYEWNPRAAGWLQAVEMPHYTIWHMRDDVAQGAALFHVEQGGTETAAAILRADRGVLWCLALAGKMGGVKAIREFVAQAEVIARINHCHQMAFMTRRRGLAGMMQKAGFEQVQVLLTRAHDGRIKQQ